MDHLSGMDAVFLHAESAETPMHVGALLVLELPEGRSADFFEEVKAFMGQRLHLAPIFTRKLALMPFDLSDPVWVEDEDIDLEHHVRHVTLPRPGSNRQLQQVIGRQHSSLLDRSRPLWEMIVIDGLKSGEVAVYVKLHHAAVDGQAGVAVGRAIFDMAPEGRTVKPPRQKLRRNQYQLGVAELAGAALRNTAQQYVKLFKMMPDMARALKSLVPEKGAAAERRWSIGKLSDMVAPRTPLNVAITNQRSFAGRTVPVAEIKLIASRLDVSFNDVVMATTAGALRQYLKASEELPARSMLAAVPVSLREEGDASNNNQVTIMTMDLATDEADPLARVRKIRAGSSQRKSAMDSFRAAIPTDFPIFAAPWLISGLASLYGRSRIANWVPPPANLVISNVPGIPAQLYFAGAKVLCNYPVSIVTHGMALNVTVQSYNGRLDYGLVACRKALPDLNELGDYLLAEHRRLLALATAADAPPQTPRPAATPQDATDAAPPRRKSGPTRRKAVAPVPAPEAVAANGKGRPRARKPAARGAEGRLDIAS